MTCLLSLACFARPALAGEAARQLAQAESGLDTPELVAAILGYTVWPGAADRSLTLCVSRTAAEAGAILALAGGPRVRWPLQGRSIDADAAPAAGCDIVYFEGWEPQAQREVLRGLAGRPVLSIGRGHEFCSDGGLFCLATGAAGQRFEVNLDAVARSGLRVNPQVLRLARPRGAGRS
ncbi:MAG: YfiR family protein [Roseateles sp.]|uniref:YfiR family protein n=1 Tax=Roseateles sp. TaxID=1971397 RepID=UPI0039EBAA76